MLAFQITKHNSPPELQNLSLEPPNRDQVQVRIMACGVNFADLLMCNGTYQDMPDLPFTLGMEIAGVISATGPDVTDFKTGDRVMVFCGHGGFAEFGNFDTANCISMPDEMSFEAAAAIQIGHGTGHLALTRRARLKPGETLLVFGAAGGVGLGAVTIGKHLGARVIAVARGQLKLDVAAAAGADHLLDSGTQDIRSAVKSLGGADVVFDPVGGDAFDTAMRTTNPEGRILSIGFASGTVPQIPANILLVKNLSVLGFYWSGYRKFNPGALRDSLTELISWCSAGVFEPHISHILPLEQSADALDILQKRQSTGKIIIKPQPEQR